MKTFNQIINEMFKIQEAEIRDDLTPKDIPDWDSMNYLLFIAELEKNFSLTFSMDEVINAKCVGDLRKIIEVRGKTA